MTFCRVCIHCKVANTLELETGDHVVFTIINKDTFQVEVQRPKGLDIPKYSFKDLLSEDDKPLSEMDWGEPVGAERI